MNDIALAIFIILLLLLFIWILVRRLLKKNKVVLVEETSLNWKEVKCPHCATIVQHGYAFAGKGIFWAEKHAKPGAFSHIGQALENTFSISLRPNLNMTWHCNSCKMILIDHSRILKIKESVKMTKENGRVTMLRVMAAVKSKSAAA